MDECGEWDVRCICVWLGAAWVEKGVGRVYMCFGCRGVASHPAGLHGRLAPNTVNRL